MPIVPRDRSDARFRGLAAEAPPTSPASPASPASLSGFRSRPARVVAAVALGALALLAWNRERARAADARTLVDAAAAVGLDSPDLESVRRAVAREADPASARVEVARVLLRSSLLVRDPESAAAFARLELAGRLAKEALVLRPASAEALMIAGATVAIERSRRRDTRLFSLAREWEAPLEAAIALAPGAEQPRHLLAAAYLDVWPALLPAKREVARALLREALADRPTFERLFDPWVTMAGSLDAAAELLPADPRAFERLAATARERGDWSAFVRFVERRREALDAGFARDLAEAREALAKGRGLRGGLFEEILAAAPRDRDFAGVVADALALRPAGPASDREGDAARAWLAWTIPLCLTTECPFDAAAIDRLASLSGGRLAPEQGALAALVAGDDARADLLERRSDTLWSEAWAPYLTFKGARLAGEGRADEARAALSTAHRAFRSRVAWRRAAAAAELSGATTAGLPPLARERWEPTDWWFDRGASRLDLDAARAARGLVATTGGSIAETVVVEPVWDGARLAPAVIPAGEGATGRFEIAVPVAPGPHLLELRTLAGSLPASLAVELAPPAPAPPPTPTPSRPIASRTAASPAS